MAKTDNKNKDENNDFEIVPSSYAEISTDPDYRDIEETDIDLLEGENFYKYQKQMITKMIEAEEEGPIETEQGTFYSRIAVNAMMPGSGKTGPTIGLCIAKPEVSKPAISMANYSSSLVSLSINETEYEYIPTSLIICPGPLVESAWKKNCDKFYGDGYYYIIKAFEQTKKEIAKDDSFETTESEMTQINKKITSIKGKINRGTAKLIDINTLPVLEERKKYLKANKSTLSIEEKINSEEEIEFIVSKMKQYPIIFCPANLFYMMIPILKQYEISRLIVDELGVIKITNQKNMISYKTDPIIEFLTRSDKSTTSISSYRERSPARMIWIITATPQQIMENTLNTDHFFISWIVKNSPFLKDYLNASDGNYMFPEMIQRYIIKFPNSYINECRNNGVVYERSYVINVKKPLLNLILDGIMGKEFDELLENDAIDELKNKLNVINTGNDPNEINFAIIQGAIDKLQSNIQDINIKESNYKNGANSKILADNDSKKNKLNKSINKIELRTSNYDLATNFVNDELDTPLLCMICESDLDKTSTCACPGCYSMCHDTCIFSSVLEVDDFRCKNCKTKITSLDQINVLVEYKDEDEDYNSATFMKKVNDSDDLEVPDIMNDSKLNALIEIIDYKSESKSNDPYKCLIYLYDSSEYKNEYEIIRHSLDKGIRVYYDKNINKAKIEELFGNNGINHLTSVSDRKKMEKYIDSFRNNKHPSVFIMRTNAQSTGLDFPFIDDIITYSENDYSLRSQIVGRADRPSRKKMFDMFEMTYV